MNQNCLGASVSGRDGSVRTASLTDPVEEN